MNKLFFTLLFLALAAYGQMQERIAIINTIDDRDSLSIADLTYLTDKLRETAVKLLPKERYGVMTTESIVAFLGSQERLVKVCKESSCLAELGRQVSADYVAQGRIGRFGKDLTIKVELYNVKSGVLMDSFTGDSKNIYGLRDIIDEKAADLFKKISSTSNIAVVPQQGQQDVNMEQRAKIQKLIDKGLAENKEEIKKESLYLSYIDKSNLYADNRMNAVGYLVLNVFPFGLGSYIQGDKSSGVILSIVDVVGGSMLAYGIAKLDESYYSSVEYTMTVIISSVILGSSRIAGLIFAYNYANKYNKLLNEALNNNNVSFSIAPLIVPRDGTPAVGLAFNVRY